MAKPLQPDFFREIPCRPPVMVALGMGVDSVSMIIEMHSLGMPIDQVLFADTGSEKPETYEYEKLFSKWMADRSIPYERVAYQPSRLTKNQPQYKTLEENCLTNGTLPSIALGRHSCSQKWKQDPQHKWTKAWEPAARAWATNIRVKKAIGYDCSPADIRRHAHQEGFDDKYYELFFPLRDWGWKRAECEERIRKEGLPIPMKSACFFCTASKTEEVRALSKVHLRRIVLMEARAAPRLKTCHGLWRSPVKGLRGATPRPGSMTQFIRDERLLSEAEIDLIWNEAPKALVAWQETISDKPMHERPALRSWLDFFDRHGGMFSSDGARELYGEAYQQLQETLEEVRAAA